VARLKIMADLDISEHRKPQDGKIDFARFGGPKVELRMVTVPTHAGWRTWCCGCCRACKPDAAGRHRPVAGQPGRPAQTMAKPYGLILICGPTGCGKTTTLHSVMRELNTDQRKIWTAEDPVEITQEGLRQVQVNARIGWTFAAAMRTFLRADPDIIMIGEMRDEETARIAVRPRSPGTWCCRRCTPIRHPRASRGCWRSAWTRSCSPTRCWPSWRSGWCGGCARTAGRPRPLGAHALQSTGAAVPGERQWHRRNAWSAELQALAPGMATAKGASRLCQYHRRLHAQLRRHRLPGPHGLHELMLAGERLARTASATGHGRLNCRPRRWPPACSPCARTASKRCWPA
jgi:energy-coupling factor transporter ATP-binding protein EcfA2